MATFSIIIEKGQDGYLISEVVGLLGCHTQAKTMDELLKRTKEAISLCLKEQEPMINENDFIGLQKVEV